MFDFICLKSVEVLDFVFGAFSTLFSNISNLSLPLVIASMVFCGFAFKRFVGGIFL